MAKLDEGFEEVPLELDEGVEETSLDDGFEEVQMSSEEPPSKIDSALTGAAQGATLGFSDELKGAGKAAYDVATTDSELQNLMNLYEQYRDIERAKIKKAEIANPKSYLAGNVAAGIGTAFIPGLGPLSALKAGASAGKVIGQGAVLGGLAGAGTSDVDLTEPTMQNVSEFSRDAALGAGVGAVTSGVLGVALPKTVSTLKNTSLPKTFTGSYEAARNWVDFATPEQQKVVFQKTLDLSKDYGFGLEQSRRIVGDRINAAIKAADESGIKVDLGDILLQAEQEIKELASRPIGSQSRNELNQIGNLVDEATQGIPKQIEVPTVTDKVIPAVEGSRKQLIRDASKKVAEAREVGQNLTYDILDEVNDLGEPILVARFRNKGDFGSEKLVSTPEVNPLTGELDATDGGITIEKSYLETPTPQSLRKPNIPEVPEQKVQIPGFEKQTIYTNANPEGKLSPTDAVMFKRSLSDKALNKDFTSNEVKKLARDQSKLVSDRVEESIPGLETVNPQYQKILESMKYIGLKTDDFIDATDTEVAAKVAKQLTNMSSDNLNNIISSEKLTNSLSALEDAGFSEAAKQYKEKLLQQAEYYDLAKTASSKGLSTLKDLALSLQGKFAVAGNLLGQVSRNLPKTTATIGSISSGVNSVASKLPARLTPMAETQNPSNLSKNLYMADEQELDQIASTLEADPQYKVYGEVLKKALSEKSNEKKNATLFTILQNPNMRRLIYGEELAK
jgi:hypothetical protein